MSADRITLKGLRARGRHGVLAAERELGQEFVIDATLFLDTGPAAAGDDLTKTVHYGELAAALTRVVETEQPQLLERLAERLAEVTLGFDGVSDGTVAVRKLRPPVPQQLDTAGVRIARSR